MVNVHPCLDIGHRRVMDRHEEKVDPGEIVSPRVQPQPLRRPGSQFAHRVECEHPRVIADVGGYQRLPRSSGNAAHQFSMQSSGLHCENSWLPMAGRTRMPAARHGAVSMRNCA